MRVEAFIILLYERRFIYLETCISQTNGIQMFVDLINSM